METERIIGWLKARSEIQEKQLRFMTNQIDSIDKKIDVLIAKENQRKGISRALHLMLGIGMGIFLGK